MGLRSSAKPGPSVSLDWRTPLSSEKDRAYFSALHGLETSYGMFSVSLDEAFGMRRGGRLLKAYQLLAVAPALCEKLVSPLLSLLRAMTQHARHFGTSPNLAAMDPENFHNSKSQRVARFNSIFSHVLLTRRSQFLYKLSTLSDLIEDLRINFCDTVEELGDGSFCKPARHWESLDASHYDLNTCLRESEVLLKCFLLALPEKQLAEFQVTLLQAGQAVPSPSRVPSHSRNLAHRRLAPLKGQ